MLLCEKPLRAAHAQICVINYKISSSWKSVEGEREAKVMRVGNTNPTPISAHAHMGSLSFTGSANHYSLCTISRSPKNSLVTVA